jgi:hypothetical protein
MATALGSGDDERLKDEALMAGADIITYNMIPQPMVKALADVPSAVWGYGVNRGGSGLQFAGPLLKDMGDAFMAARGLADGPTPAEGVMAAWRAIGMLGVVLGIPVDNMRKDIKWVEEQVKEFKEAAK